MESKVGGIPLVAILFVILTAACVSGLDIAYMHFFIYPKQQKVLMQIEQEVHGLVTPSAMPAVVSPTVTPTPELKAKTVPVTHSTLPASSSAK